MNMQQLRVEFNRLRQDNDLEGIARLLCDHNEMVKDKDTAAMMIHYAARAGETALVALVVKNGVDVNCPHDDQIPNRPISTAAALNRTDTVRWLIEHGSEINYEWDGLKPRCGALVSAIINGNVEMAQMLVEAGAYLNVLDRRNLTPLSWAILYNRTEIAAYLRSKGALEAHQIPGWVDPLTKDPVANQVKMYVIV